MNIAHPILSCKESAELEKKLLGTDGTKVWSAMSKVGKRLGHAILEDYREVQTAEGKLRILILAGKGNNAGDAFLAAAEILQKRPDALVKIIHVFGKAALRETAKHALEILQSIKAIEEISVNSYEISNMQAWTMESLGSEEYEICIDGVLGMSFKPPLSAFLEDFFNEINQYCDGRVGLRAAVDVPSGLGDECGNTCFVADFTYATGTAKSPIFQEEHKDYIGRIRYLNIGFFDTGYEGSHDGGEYILRKAGLRQLQRLRKSTSDKRSYGHLFIVSGSWELPGAMLMSAMAALKSGVGLVTVFAPESLVASIAAHIPEAMWVACPETPSGALSPEGYSLLADKIERADALLVGPGMGKDPKSLDFVRKVVEGVDKPMVLDADALQPSIAKLIAKRPEGHGQVIMTPHEGEFLRMNADEVPGEIKTAFRDWCKNNNILGLLKGRIARIAHDGATYNSTFGGPILARGGSGDILAGLIGGLLAQMPDDPFAATRLGLVWQGSAADAWAREEGQVGVKTTGILEYLGKALRSL